MRRQSDTAKYRNCPKLQETQDLVDSGAPAGDGKDNLNVTEDMVYTMIITKRYPQLTRYT